MISLVPLAMLAGFGYLVYRWSASGSTNKGSRQSQKAQNTQVQVGQQGNEALRNKGAAAIAANFPH